MLAKFPNLADWINNTGISATTTPVDCDLVVHKQLVYGCSERLEMQPPRHHKQFRISSSCDWYGDCS